MILTNLDLINTDDQDVSLELRRLTKRINNLEEELGQWTGELQRRTVCTAQLNSSGTARAKSTNGKYWTPTGGQCQPRSDFELDLFYFLLPLFLALTRAPLLVYVVTT